MISEVFIEYDNRQISVNALWDTGATTTCVSPNVVQSLSMIPTGKMNSHTASGVSVVNTYLANIILPNHVRVTDVMMMDAAIGQRGFDVLIGMDVITTGDFCVSNYQGKTVLTFRIPSEGLTDYVPSSILKNKGLPAGRRRKG